MRSSKIKLAGIATTTLLIVGLIAANMAGATDLKSHNLLVSKIAERFGLNEKDVQEVFSEAHLEKRSQMKAEFEDRLNSAVAAGTLTTEQRDEIISKKSELSELHLNSQDLSDEERKEQFSKLKEEMRAWHEDNDIDFGQFGQHKYSGYRFGFH